MTSSAQDSEILHKKIVANTGGGNVRPLYPKENNVEMEAEMF